MVGMTFEGITGRMKAELGVHVSTAVTNLLQVATPDLAALTQGSTKTEKAVQPSAQKS